MHSKLTAILAGACLSTAALAQTPPASPPPPLPAEQTGHQAGSNVAKDKAAHSGPAGSTQDAQARANPAHPVDNCKLDDGRVDKTNAMNSVVCNNSRPMETQAKRAGNNRDKREVRP
ncbi:hypothetical protein [Duganella callida]|uniref:Uncharacterized protein n=1 Tax=Duganella callida TaxID=2561932 RepID=A0A4Y9SKY5_9BURK|nr:hypothetical protein [Duganella callida]TFW23730.1 hypothetical protein E4L98_10985 [Duganella callida]